MKKYIEAVILFAKCVMVLAKIFGMWSDNQQRIKEGSSMAYPHSSFVAEAEGLIKDTAKLQEYL